MPSRARRCNARVVPVERRLRATLPTVARRTWMFMLVGAILGVAFGLVYVLLFDPLCGCEGVPKRCSCPLAVPVWTAIGIVGGGLVGFVADRVTRRT